MIQRAFAECEHLVGFLSVPCCYSKVQVEIRPVLSFLSDLKQKVVAAERMGYFISDTVRGRVDAVAEGKEKKKNAVFACSKKQKKDRCWQHLVLLL